MSTDVAFGAVETANWTAEEFLDRLTEQRETEYADFAPDDVELCCNNCGSHNVKKVEPEWYARQEIVKAVWHLINVRTGHEVVATPWDKALVHLPGLGDVSVLARIQKPWVPIHEMLANVAGTVYRVEGDSYWEPLEGALDMERWHPVGKKLEAKIAEIKLNI